MYNHELFESYSSKEACEVATMAKAKGLTLLEGNYFNPLDTTDNKSKGYCVAKVIAGQYLTLADDGSVYPSFRLCGSYKNRTGEFHLTLAQAKEQIMNFNGIIKNPPAFYAFVRVYNEEPEYYGFLQRLYLEDFARKHGIAYKELFICIGGRQSTAEFSSDTAAVFDILDCCKKSFSKITKNDFLVVSDMSRLNGEMYIWRTTFNIVSVNLEETSYMKYEYHKSTESEEDMEYEQMAQEHMEMMMAQDEQSFVEGVEENE